MREQTVIEGTVLTADEQNDPDLNAAWFDFREQLEKEANSSGSIAVFEIPIDSQGNPRPKTLNKTKLFTTPVGTATLDDICDRVMREFMEPGGRLTVQLLGTIEGHRGIKLNKIISLRRAKETKDEPDSNSLAGLLKIIQETNEATRREMRTMMSEVLAARTAQPQQNPFEFGLALAERLSTIAGGMARGGAPAVQSNDWTQNMMQTMQMMTMMRKFFGDGERDGKKESPTDPSQFLSIIKEVRELAAPLLQAHVADSAAKALREKRLLQHETATADPPAAVSPTSEPPPDSPAADSAHMPDTAPIDEVSRMRLLGEFKLALPMLCDMAERGADIKQTVSLALSAMPDDQALNDALFHFVSEEDCVSKLIAMEPRVEKSREWFEKFRVELRAEFEPDEHP